MVVDPTQSVSASGSGLERRLPWLLVFRAGIATILVCLTLAADLADLPLRRVSGMLYGVAVGSYLVVVVLGLLLRARTSALVVSAVYLAMAVAAAFTAVQATGGVDSSLSFLYLLTILDGAIIGGRRVALAVATASSLIYGAQLMLQLYGILPQGPPVLAFDWRYTWAFSSHLVAFYMTALLSSYLADLVRRAREEASIIGSDLAHAHELHAVILASLPVGVLTVDADHVVRTANAGARRILGAALVLGRRVPEELVGAGGVREVELSQTGGKKLVWVGRAPLPPEAGRALDVLVLEDRTERAALERALQAQARLASIGEMAAAIAHELRNPLAAISGAVELLGAGDHRRLQEIVAREVTRLDRLVEDFLLYARPSPAERAAIDVAALIRELAEVLRADAAWAGHRLEVTAPDRLTAQVDPRQLKQLLWNLLKNALDVTPSGAPVELSVNERAGRLLLEVRDRGPGIDPAIRPHLFEPFRTTKANGTGLGLAIVHRIVEGHGGEVELVPAEGGGTVAKVVVPVA